MRWLAIIPVLTLACSDEGTTRGIDGGPSGIDASVAVDAGVAGGGCGAACLDQAYMLSDDDFDGDGVPDAADVCPRIRDPGQADADGDGRGDICDNAPRLSNPDQLDTDGDGLGDVVDPDDDGDGVADGTDNCPMAPNPSQANLTRNSLGDACDPDDDGDGIIDEDDPCPKLVGVTDQSVSGCRGDVDVDRIPDSFDNCPGIANANQEDSDGDRIGNFCDPDLDGDGVANTLDNSPEIPNADQLDLDRDGIGDVSDDDFCFVLDQRVPADCLSPRGPFDVAAHAISQPDGSFALFFSTNRLAAPLDYAWSLVSAPTGSAVTLDTSGASSEAAFVAEFENVGVSLRLQSDGPAPVIVPDQTGVFEFQVDAQMRGDDWVVSGGPTQATATVRLQLDCLCGE